MSQNKPYRLQKLVYEKEKELRENKEKLTKVENDLQLLIGKTLAKARNQRMSLEKEASDLLSKIQMAKDQRAFSKEISEEKSEDQKTSARVHSVFQKNIKDVFKPVNDKLEVVIQFNNEKFNLEIDAPQVKKFKDIKQSVCSLFALDHEKTFFKIPNSGIVFDHMMIVDVLLPLRVMTVQDYPPELEMVLIYDLSINEIISRQGVHPIEDKDQPQREEAQNDEKMKKIEFLLADKDRIHKSRKDKESEKRKTWRNNVISIVLNIFYFISIISFCFIQIFSSDVKEMNLYFLLLKFGVSESMVFYEVG